MNNMSETNARVIESYGLTDRLHSLTLEMPGNAQPGQFLHIACGDGLTLRRPISICSADNGLMRIVFEIKGEGTRRLARARAGDVLDVLGPLGKGFTRPSGKKILLVGGGLGSAPMLFAAQRWPGCEAVLGFSSADRIILSEEFRKACPGYEIATDDGTAGFHGFVTELVANKLSDGDYSVLACGPELMLRATAKVCSAAGASLQVSMERRMGCGVGACLVCAVKLSDGSYARACKDGPVFDAREVDWNG